MSQTPIRELTQKYNYNQIISKCKDLFYDKQIHEVTSDEISKFCGYSKKTIYAYFNSKEEILLTIEKICFDKFFADMDTQEFNDFDSFIDYIYAYKNLNQKDFFFIAKKKFKKGNEDDYFLFSQKFKAMIDLLVEKCNYIYTSIDTPLLIWNSITYAIENNIQPTILVDFIL